MKKDKVITLNSLNKEKLVETTPEEINTVSDTKQKNVSNPVMNIQPQVKVLNNSATSSNQSETSFDENNTDVEVKYFTNPMYQKLLEFKEKQKKERFTVEDLLKW